MNENKTAITEMREWLEIRIKELDNGVNLSLANWQREKAHNDRETFLKKMLDKACALESSQAEKDKGEDIEDYDAGLLNDYGGGNVGWWQDYIRNVLAACNEHWRETLTRHEKGVK